MTTWAAGAAMASASASAKHARTSKRGSRSAAPSRAQLRCLRLRGQHDRGVEALFFGEAGLGSSLAHRHACVTRVATPANRSSVEGSTADSFDNMAAQALSSLSQSRTMDKDDVISGEANYIVGTYVRPPVVFTHGKGSHTLSMPPCHSTPSAREAG